MYYRVFFGGALAEVFENCFHIGLGEQLRQVVHQPGDAIVKVIASDILEQLPKKWVCSRQILGSVEAGKGSAIVGYAASGEQSVCDGLGIHISKIIN